MKVTTVGVLLLLSAEVCAAEYEKPPKGLEDGEYTFKLKSGQTHKFNSNEWKIVKRIKRTKIDKSVKVITEPATCIPTVEEVIVEVEVEKVVEKEVDKIVRIFTYRPNRMNFILGYGSIGLQSSATGLDSKVYTIEEKFGPVVGAQYSYQFSEFFSVGVGYLTSHTFLGSAGISWGRK